MIMLAVIENIYLLLLFDNYNNMLHRTLKPSLFSTYKREVIEDVDTPKSIGPNRKASEHILLKRYL